ncbi:heme-binding protein [Ammonicoccus fulvus]|uniref:Heme-binding protein n=1 Tax=Ammonicoccus fulvus TaxID=3138240 RepID=A0ABZ3FQS3_9ACTN
MSDLIRSQQNLTRAGARAALDAALAKAEELNTRMNIAVVDAGGHLVSFERMDGAMLISSGIAQDKAYSVVIGNGLPTSQWVPALSGDPDPGLLRSFPHRDRLIMFGGGVPIKVGDEVIGAVGVSGGSAEEDAIVAQAGADAVV